MFCNYFHLTNEFDLTSLHSDKLTQSTLTCIFGISEIMQNVYIIDH